MDKYNWVDIGSSFLPSEIIAAFLYAQLECLESIQQKRIKLWNLYYSLLEPLEQKGFIELPRIHADASNNAHMFYVVCKNETERNSLINYLKQHNINDVFHYLSLHASPFYKQLYRGDELKNSNHFSV